jgi:hypothetical protein
VKKPKKPEKMTHTGLRLPPRQLRRIEERRRSGESTAGAIRRLLDYALDMDDPKEITK